MIGIVEVACFRGEYRSHAAHEDHVDLAANEVGRALDSEPDLLAVGELERMAVGVGDARDIADRVAGIDRGAGRPALATSFRIEPVDLLAGRRPRPRRSTRR